MKIIFLPEPDFVTFCSECESGAYGLLFEEIEPIPEAVRSYRFLYGKCFDHLLAVEAQLQSVD